MSEKIKLSELREIRAAMTPGPYGVFEVDAGLDESETTINAPTGEVAMMSSYDVNDRPEENAAGIVATNNAADALIEIVEALLARRTAVRARVEANKAKWTDDWENQEARYQALLANEELCGERLERALAEVEP